MRFPRFSRDRSPRTRTGIPAVPRTGTGDRSHSQAWVDFALAAIMRGVTDADARRIADHCVSASATYGCSYRMLLSVATVHLAAGKPIDEVLDLITDNAAVSYPAVARWVQ